MKVAAHFKKDMANNGTERTRKNTSPILNQKIDQEIRENLELYSDAEQQEGIAERIEVLNKEWDIDRSLQLNSALTAITGLCLGLLVNKKWFALSFITSAFLAQHSIQGWCPPLPLFRKLGFRTRKEIDKEKYALKALRGDFKRIGLNPGKAYLAANE